MLTLHPLSTVTSMGFDPSEPAPSEDSAAVVKQAVDIVQVVGEYIRLDHRGGKYYALCPFHDDRKPSFQVDPKFQNYRCWACGAKGDVLTFVQQFEKITFVEALERLAQRAGIVLKKGSGASSSRRASLLKVLEWASQQFSKALWEPTTGKLGRDYLGQRKVEEGTARQHTIGWAPPEFDWLTARANRAGIASELLVSAGLAKVGNRSTPYDAFRGRLIFPIRDPQGRVIAFGGRIHPSLEEEGRSPKYLNSPGTEVYNKSTVLYGLDVASKGLRSTGARNELVVMEGYMDCLMAYQSGLGTAVATCGTALTAEHIKRLRSYTDRVVLMFDGDLAGQKASREATILFLQSEVDLRLCVLPDHLDPCDFLISRGLEEMNRLIERAPDALEFTLQRVKTAYASSSLDGRSRAVDEVLETLSALPVVLRSREHQRLDLALNRTAEAFGVKEDILRGRLQSLRAGRRDSTVRSDTRELGNDRPMQPIPARERLLAELLLASPREGFEALGGLVTEEWFSHPELRQLVTAFRAHLIRSGVESDDSARLELADPRLEKLSQELIESAPKGVEYTRALADVRALLESERQRKLLESAVKLESGSTADDHLELLRSLRTRSAL